jgi:pyrophosphate--fructose-6-phosphate 1-phosphotransferase
MVLIKKAYAYKTINHVVNDLCDYIDKRSKSGKDYGCMIFPDSFISELPVFKILIEEINDLMKNKTVDERKVYNKRLLKSDELSPWNFALYNTMPYLFRRQVINFRKNDGTVDFARLCSEKMLAKLCSEELARRKEKGTYTGKFAAVTHHFTFQGRAAHPSTFD